MNAIRLLRFFWISLFSVLMVACGGGGGSSDPGNAGGSGAPVISTQPAAVAVQPGQTASFAVTASGSALTYQWRRNGSDIAGATTAAYSFSTVQADNGAVFSVVVSNAAGSVTSTNAGLSVAVSNPASTMPLALEHCPASPAVAGAPAVPTALSVQSASGFDGGQGHLSVEANGVRSGRESGLKSAVNCVAWRDADGTPRALNLGAYLFDYVLGATPRRVATDDADGHPGFGYVVSHNTQNGNSPLGSFMNPSAVETVVFAGANHAIHRVTLNYTRNSEAGGNGVVIPVVIEWLVAAGRSDPVWAVNWQMNQVINPNSVNFDTYRMDARGPYGSIAWDGKLHSAGTDSAVGEIQWGAGGYRFETTGALTIDSPWSHQQLSAANYVLAKEFPGAQSYGLQFAIVQTKRDSYAGYPDGISGLRGKTSNMYGNVCNGHLMPCDWMWPYQMMQYGISAVPTTNKMMGWGTQFGYLGASSLPSFDYTANESATGERSYATFISWGYNGAQRDATDMADGASYWTTMSTFAGVGTVSTQTAYPGSALQHALPANGYNDSYSAFELNATQGKVDAELWLQPGTTAKLRNPLFIINNYQAGVPAIVLDGTPLVNGIDFYVSYDTAKNRLWLTLLRTLNPNTKTRIKIN